MKLEDHIIIWQESGINESIIGHMVMSHRHPHSPAEVEPHELDALILQWHRETFPNATAAGVIDKLVEEASELKEAQQELEAFLMQYGEPVVAELAGELDRLVAHRDEEWADVYITLVVLKRYGVAAGAAVDTKHKINLYRDWDTRRMRHR